jgi:uncharacterized protein (DUF1499 family)
MNKGIIKGKLSELPSSPNCVSSQTKDKTKFVKPFKFKGNLDKTKKAIKKVLEEYGRIKIETEDMNYIHAVSTTKIMRFKDDLEFLFDEKEKLVHFRSESRVGHSDLGLNRKRYDKFVKLYEKN